MKKQKENKLMWKILIILLLLFAVVIWFKGEYDKKQILEDYSDCVIKKNLCNGYLNETLQGWKQCIFAVGYSLNMTDEEIEYELGEGENPFYLNSTKELNSTEGTK